MRRDAYGSSRARGGVRRASPEARARSPRARRRDAGPYGAAAIIAGPEIAVDDSDIFDRK